MEKTKILIVEDETITAMEIESQLQGLGYEITSIVDTGEKAIQKAEEDKPDLILMDIRIKGEMDGIDTAEEIRNKFGIPVIFSTAYLDEERIERAKITMPFGYVLKPIQERDLKVTIEMALYVTKVDTERKKAEQKIQNSEKEYRALANNIPAMIYRGNPDWSSKMVSNSILLSGYSSDEFNSGKVRWLDIIHPDDKESVYQKGVELMVEPMDIVQTYKIVSKDGDVVWVEDRKTSIFTEEGVFSGVDGVVFDVTERKMMELALKSSQQKLLIHVKQTLMAVVEYDINFRVVEWNPAAERIFGYTEEEATGRDVGELIVPASAKAHVENIWESLINQKGGNRSINENITKNGEHIICEWHNTALVDKNGVVMGIASLGQDITERIHAEEDLKKAHEELKKGIEERTRLVSAIEQSNDNIVITDPEGNIEYINPAFEHNTGYFLSEVLGENPRILKSGKHDKTFYQNLWETITNGEIWTGNIINKRKDGTFIEESATIFPVMTPEGEIKNFVSVKRDMTEQLNIEKQLRQAQKLDAVGTLASGIAHDFNNILSAIFAYTQLSKKKISNFPEAHTVVGYLDKIFAASSRAKELIDQILTFSRKGEYAPVNIDLNPLLKESIRFLRAIIPSTISIKQDIDQDLKNVYGDPAQIQQIIMNLCTNASHAMEEKGGTLEVAMTNYKIKHKGPNTGNLEPGDALLLTVSDSGHGMTEETKQRIFEPFYTTKEKGKGTGLGLSIVHGIVTRHGGCISVNSEEGLGTKFNIFLPAATDNSIKDIDAIVSELPGGSECILLVDDELDIRSAYKKLLEQQGYTVQAESSSVDALNRFKKTPSDYDLIITDYTMPEINGIALSREIHKVLPDIPIILISGLGKLIRDEELESAGIASRLSKPIEFEVLIRGVRDALDGNS
ncbi:MAG: PAS domain S-box protein [Deltaproteobacteria bacterium]|jgi:two-component system, cell cycle sensor histidine kinase and response regulator CckA|nr:PAS domain S-box protein [Deltaproteobacteria bacterium]